MSAAKTTLQSFYERGYHQCPSCRSIIRHTVCPFCKRDMNPPQLRLPLEVKK